MSTTRVSAKGSRRSGKARLRACISALKKRAQRDLDQLRELCRLNQLAESGTTPAPAGRGRKSLKTQL